MKYSTKSKQDLIEIIEQQQARIEQYQENNAERLMLTKPLGQQNATLKQQLDKAVEALELCLKDKDMDAWKNARQAIKQIKGE